MKIALVGETILRTPALPVKLHEIQGRECQHFVEQLKATMLEAKGIGIAAPQVFDPRAIMIIASRPNSRYPNAPEMDPLVMINPQILSHSQETHKDWEGCLSVPALRGRIERFEWVEVEYVDINSNIQTQRFEGFVARIFQHEFDHLIGKTWLDHIENAQDIVAEAVWLKNN